MFYFFCLLFAVFCSLFRCQTVPANIQTDVIISVAGGESPAVPSAYVWTECANTEQGIQVSVIPNGEGELYLQEGNPNTTIKFGLAEKSGVRLAVYDMLGKEVAVLADGTMNSGTYSVVFDGAKLASGVYLYKLSAGSLVITKKLVLMK